MIKIIITITIRMKCHLDYCRLQWVIREFLPLKYMFKNKLNESRFCSIFPSIIEKEEEVSTSSNSDDQNRCKNTKMQAKGASDKSKAIEKTSSQKQTNYTKLVQISKVSLILINGYFHSLDLIPRR